MPSEIKESDWKLFRRFHEIALERFSKQVIEEINDATSNCTQDYHNRYLEIFNLIMDRNEQMARAFDDERRSNAFHPAGQHQGESVADRPGVFRV